VDVLTVVFQGNTELLAQREHLARGCLFVPDPEPMPDTLADIIVYVCAPDGSEAEFKARVLQVVPGTGVALGFADQQAARKQLDAWLERAARAAPSSGPTVVCWGRASGLPPSPTPRPVSARPPPAAEEVPAEADADADADADAALQEEKPPGLLVDQIRAMSSQQRMHLAAHGDRTARLILLKDPNKTIQSFVLQNPHVTIEEVRYLAAFRQASPDALQMIAGHREWSQNAGVVTALVRNPKTPLNIAVRMLDRLSQTELRRVAKSNDVPRGVVLAARKKVGGTP
jgi:hypothetical protein